jgi:hypothetical protein
MTTGEEMLMHVSDRERLRQAFLASSLELAIAEHASLISLRDQIAAIGTDEEFRAARPALRQIVDQLREQADARGAI